MKIAAYIRVSTEDQADRGSPEVQVAEIKRYVDYHRLALTELYSDEGISGTVPFAQRPQGARLLADARAKKIGAVVFYALDRVGRTVRVILEAMDAFTALGLDVHCVKDRLDTTTAGGKIAYHVLMVLAEIERDTLLTRTEGGRRRIAKEGKWLGGGLPWGYDSVDGKLQPNAQAFIVQELFRRIADGSSLVKECERLNSLGVAPTRFFAGSKVEGTRWKTQTLSSILRNEVYLGHHRTKYGTIEVPALADRDLWDRAHAQLRTNKTLPRSKSRVNLLRGLIKCDACGRHYVCAPDRPGLYYYRCAGGLKSTVPNVADRCHAARIRADQIEAQVWEQCKDYVRRFDAIADTFEARIAEMKPARANRGALERTLAEKALEKDRVLGLVRRAKISDAEADKVFDDIAQERAAITARLEALDNADQLHQARVDRLREARALVASYAPRLHEIDQDPAAKRALLEMLLAEVVVYTTGSGHGKKSSAMAFWWSSAMEPLDLADVDDVPEKV